MLVFKSCSSGRNMPLEYVKKLAQGQLYTGSQALDVGLVDQLGTLQNAIDMMNPGHLRRHSRT